MTLDEMHAVDPSNMYRLIKEFPAQAREAIRIGKETSITLPVRGIRDIVLCGLGGSAIGGDLLKSYLGAELKVPFLVNRHYVLPGFVGPTTLVIISSYSGNTEETNAAHREALKRKARILCISSNGMTEKLARRSRAPLIKIPGGQPPRSALAYSFFPLLIALSRLGFIKDKTREIKEALALLDQKSAEYSNPDPAVNRALQLASDFNGRIGIIYSSTERFDAVNTRWRGQLAENAKTLCFGNVLPEMNHNELVGWKALKDQMHDMQVVFLRDRGDYPRVKVRMDITKEVISQYTPHIAEVWSEGTTLLARVLSLVTLGDWVSYYLAILHREDPWPVAVIDHLKSELAKL
ncbi:bifunctional phosphoglucose/phosphomannose isomerase [bacterium]|nr:MAG: bifunctional phosphoglucose/phosphomannose isomerase [bacterium]